MTISQTEIGSSAVAIHGRALLIKGSPGSGKSTLALSLIDRGATLIGDDGVTFESQADCVMVTPPPKIAGKLEIRGVGIVEMEITSAPLALILDLTSDVQRIPEELDRREILQCQIPVLPFIAGGADQAIRAEWALRTRGLSF